MTTSRREFLASSAMAALVATFGRPGFAFSWPAGAQQATPAWTAIRRNVGFFTMRGGTIGYLTSSAGTAVVDTQFPDSAAAFLAGLRDRSARLPVDVLINTHHHGDHTGGNIAFKGSVKSVVAHAKAAEHMKSPPGTTPPAAGATPPEQLYPDTTFPENWVTDLGDERIHARHFGRAHTSGDVVVTFERANVAHMGDLMFNQRHPVVDRAAGASLRNWMKVLDATIAAHSTDTIYIFGHANTNLPVTGSSKELVLFRDYIGALLAFVDTQVKAGKSREEIMAMRDPLKGFETFGRFGNPGGRDPLTVAYEEVTVG